MPPIFTAHLDRRHAFRQEHRVDEGPRQAKRHDRELGNVVQGKKHGAPNNPRR